MRALDALGILISFAYPLLILIGYRFLSLPPSVIACGVLAISLSHIFIKRTFRDRIPSVIMALAALLVLLTGAEVILRFYPVVINALFLFSFYTSVRGEDSIIYSFTLLMYREMEWASYKHKVKRYCKRLCYVWSAFFAINSLAILFLMLKASLDVWALYTGVIQYLVMGALFAGEFLIRIWVDRQNTKAIAFPDLRTDSREEDRIIAYSGRFEDGEHKTWKDYLEETARIRAVISRKGPDGVVVLCEDFWKFLVTFSSAMEMGVEAILTPNRSPGFMKELERAKHVLIIDDETYDSFLGSAPAPDDISLPCVSPDAKVTLYTSGSTGKPKQVTHTIAGLSRDNGTLHGHWDKDFRWRTVVSTVSPCHIFGLLYAVISPFRSGLPIRRERVEYPEEFTTLGKGKLLIVSSPQYLKIAAETVSELDLRDPRVVVSGGVLPETVARDTESVFGAWPIEVYGSTETGGLAWRVTEKTKAWTLSPDARLSLSDDGCLIVSCAYLDKPFQTNDFAEFTGGSFELLGRKDSIVKLAEKRIDLREVETKLQDTGLVKEAAVVVLEGSYRKYLGAVVVLDKGLAGLGRNDCIRILRGYLSSYLEPAAVPRRWRFVDNIQRNSMGKIQQEAVRALFESEAE